MRKNLYDRILRRELKEQYLSTVPKSCHYFKVELLILNEVANYRP